MGTASDIITELSRFSELFVIARNSSFQYKGKSHDIRQVGRELGVRYVLEGSIRRGGDRVRITAQLIDATTGGHRWAERYDRKLEDVFAVQDEVARDIVTALTAHVNNAEVERRLLKPPATWQAHDYYLRAKGMGASFWTSFRVQELYECRALLERALAIDPKYAHALALLANTYSTAFSQPIDKEYRKGSTLERAHQIARSAVQLEPNLPDAHATLGNVLMHRGEHEAAVGEFVKALALNPNHSDPRFCMVLAYAGEYQQAITVAKRHMRLDPFFPPFVVLWLGAAHFLLKQYADAMRPIEECVSRSPNYRGGHLWLAATYAKLGYLDKARLEAKEVLSIEPAFTIGGIGRLMGSAMKHQDDVEDALDGLRRAGLPE
jgi:adenylate cyclase